MDLWTHLHHYFDTDDGSLPELGFATTSAAEIAAMFAFLRRIGQAEQSDRAAGFWDLEKQATVRVDDVPNAAALVATNRAEPFAMGLTRVQYENVDIPNLSVFVFPDSLDLYFRMGPDWIPRALHAFIRLMQALQRLAPTARLQFDQTFGDPKAFLEVWSQLNADRSFDSLQGTP